MVYLGYNDADEEAAAALASSPSVAGRDRLGLAGNRIGDASARAIAGSPYLSGLCILELAGCGIGPAGAMALADSPHLRRLEHLHLENNPLGAEACRAVYARFTAKVASCDCPAGQEASP
jgi:hypothetical protein